MRVIEKSLRTLEYACRDWANYLKRKRLPDPHSEPFGEAVLTPPSQQLHLIGGRHSTVSPPCRPPNYYAGTVWPHDAA